MTCYHPIPALIVGKKPNGKNDLVFLPFNPLLDNEKEGKIFFKYFSDGKENVGFYKDVILIPCGKCIGCRLNYSRQWADRCLLELQYHDSAFFATLTYDEEHVPKHYYVRNDDGELGTSLSLEKRDFQLFMKRLRKHFPDDNIRYYACGEYGSSTFRPHYHAIIYGLHLNDLVPVIKSKLGYQYYNSLSFQKCWSDKDGKPLGFAVLGEVTWETCAYTARYILKKKYRHEAVFYETRNLVPEFTLMSRRPGIAYQFYKDNPDIYDYEHFTVETPSGGRKMYPSRYFDNLFDVDSPDRFEEIKQKRKKFAQFRFEKELENTSLYSDEYRELKEDVKINQIKSLRRPLE